MKYLIYHLKSPEGYKVDYMTSGDKKNPLLRELIEGHDMRVATIEKYGWKLDKGFSEKKPVEIVPNVKCPKCGSPLKVIHSKKDGKIYHSCTNSKWNNNTKRYEGCDYFIDPNKPVIDFNPQDPYKSGGIDVSDWDV